MQKYNTIQYNTIQYNTIQYNTIQYNTIQYNTIQYNTIQYNTIRQPSDIKRCNEKVQNLKMLCEIDPFQAFCKIFSTGTAVYKTASSDENSKQSFSDHLMFDIYKV